MLLEEFDFNKGAVIEPWFVHQPVEDFPETVVSIFHHTLFLLAIITCVYILLIL